MLRRIVEEKLTAPKDYWLQTTKEFMKNIKIKHSDFKGMKTQKLKGKIKDWDTENWEKEVAERSSLKIYSKFKTTIKEEKFYDNKPSSIILYKARTNNLNLNDRNRHKNGDTKCIMCNYELENLNHFLLQCPAYVNERDKILETERLNTEEEEDI